MLHMFTSLIAFALLAVSALAQSTTLNCPTAGSSLKIGSKFTVQVAMGSYPENIDNVALVIGLAHCYGTCSPASQFMGTILYQGNYKPLSGNTFANYTVTVPSGFLTGAASLNVANFFMVGASYEPIIDYLNNDITITS